MKIPVSTQIQVVVGAEALTSDLVREVPCTGSFDLLPRGACIDCGAAAPPHTMIAVNNRRDCGTMQ
jgi:hypothetical protein